MYSTIIFGKWLRVEREIINKPFHSIIFKGGWRFCRVKVNEEYTCICYIYTYIGIFYILYKTVYCTLKTDTPGVHPRKLKLMKLQVSQDTNVELTSEDEKNSDTEEENQDSISSEDLEATRTSTMQRTEPCV